MNGAAVVWPLYSQFYEAVFYKFGHLATKKTHHQ